MTLQQHIQIQMAASQPSITSSNQKMPTKMVSHNLTLTFSSSSNSSSSKCLGSSPRGNLTDCSLTVCLSNQTWTLSSDLLPQRPLWASQCLKIGPKSSLKALPSLNPRHLPSSTRKARHSKFSLACKFHSSHHPTSWCNHYHSSTTLLHKPSKCSQMPLAMADSHPLSPTSNNSSSTSTPNETDNPY